MSNQSEKTRLARLKRPIGVAAAVGTISLALPMQSALADTPDRVVTDPTTGAVITIHNEGDCDTLSIDETDSGTSSSTGQGIDYTINEDCTVTVGTGQEAEAPDTPDVGGVDSSLYSEDEPDAGAVYRWAWSSQTLQDVISIDIAKLKFQMEAGISGQNVNVAYADAVASTSKSWNHVSGNPTFNIAWTKGQGSSTGHFHTDFLWCNIQSQSLWLQNKLTINADKTYSRAYARSVNCSGTHLATASGIRTTAAW